MAKSCHHWQANTVKSSVCWEGQEPTLEKNAWKVKKGAPLEQIQTGGLISIMSVIFWPELNYFILLWIKHFWYIQLVEGGYLNIDSRLDSFATFII